MRNQFISLAISSLISFLRSFAFFDSIPSKASNSEANRLRRALGVSSSSSSLPLPAPALGFFPFVGIGGNGGGGGFRFR